MGLIGNISGSSTHDYQIGLTGSVVIGRPAQTQLHLPEIGSDVVLYVSGSPGGKNISGDGLSKRKSTAVIGGDLVVSGSSYFVPRPADLSEDEVLSHVGTNVHFFVSGSVNNETVGGDGAILFGGDTIISGALVVGPAEENSELEWFVDFGTPEFYGSGIKFIVSGAVGKQGHGGYDDEGNDGGEGTVVFMGDTVISGSLTVGERRHDANNTNWWGGTISGSIHHTEQGLTYLVAGDNVQITSASNGQITIAADTDSASDDFSVGGELLLANGAVAAPSLAFTSDTNTGIWRSAADKLNISAGGVESVEVGPTYLSASQLTTGHLAGTVGDLTISNLTANKDIIFKVMDASVYTTILTMDSDIPQVHVPDGINFGYGGSANVISGSTRTELGEGLAINSHHNIWISGSDGVYFGKRTGTGATDDVGDDISFFVSGSVDSRGPSVGPKFERGVAVFGGDLVVSGNSYFIPAAAGSEDEVMSHVGTNVHFFVSGVNGVSLQDQDHGLGGSGAILLGGDTIISGALVVSPSDADGGADWQVDFGSPEFSGGGIKFIVSGAVGLQGTGETDGQGEQTVVFMGDTVVSGSLTVGERRHDSGNTNWFGGTISGSIHHTEQGLAYLVAGDNITIASASNGQVMITAAAVTAGDGLSGGGASGGVTLALDLDELTAATIAAADSIVFIDADDDGSKKETLADFLDVVAGTVGTTGLDRSGGTLVVSDLHPVGVDGANNQLLTDVGDGHVSSEANLTFDGSVLKMGTVSSANKSLPGTDVTFYVSGTTMTEAGEGGISGGPAGTTLIGGDLVISGVLAGGTEEGTSRELIIRSDSVVIIDNTGAGDEFWAASDVIFAVSGSIGSKDRGDSKGTSVINGDLVVSGATYLNLGGKTNQTLTVSEGVGLFVSGPIGGKPFGEGYGGEAVFGGDMVVSGNAYFNLSGDPDKQLWNVGPDVSFFVSGGAGDSPNGYGAGAGLFGGDLTISGSLTIGTGLSGWSFGMRVGKNYVAHDVANGTLTLSNGGRAGYIELTTDGTHSDGAYGNTFQVSSGDIMGVDVIVCTTSVENCFAYASAVAWGGSFKLTLLNETGGAINADTVLIVNWIAL